MGRKIAILAILMISVLLISGCKGTTNQNINVDNPYLGGSQGLVATFEPMGVADDNGVQNIFDDESFPVSINLKNKGEYTIPAGAMKTIIKGISPSDYTGIAFEKVNTDAIEKISEFNDKGGESTIEHGNAQLVPSRIKDRNLISATIFGEVIYPYKTFVSAPKVCFKDTTSKTRIDEICDVDSTSLQVFSSGAPIKATTAKEERSGKGLIAVTFEIENAGGGESKTPTKQDFDFRYDEIGFEVNPSSSPEKWDCRSSGRENVGRFTEDKKLTIICKLKDQYQIGENEVYQSQLDLTLTYDYKTLISSDLVIKNNDV